MSHISLFFVLIFTFALSFLSFFLFLYLPPPFFLFFMRFLSVLLNQLFLYFAPLFPPLLYRIFPFYSLSLSPTSFNSFFQIFLGHSFLSYSSSPFLTLFSLSSFLFTLIKRKEKKQNQGKIIVILKTEMSKLINESIILTISNPFQLLLSSLTRVA